MAGESQEAVQLLTVPFDWHLTETTGISVNLGLLCVPIGKNIQLEVLSVGYTNRVIVTAGTVDVEWRDSLRDAQNGLATSMAAFSTSNVIANRTLNCDGGVLATSADVLGTLIADLTAGLPLPTYNITNLTRALSHSSNANDQGLLDDQIGQLISDIQAGSIVDVVFTNTATDRDFDADSTTILELADIVQNLHDDLTPTADLAASANLSNQGIEGYVNIWEGSRLLNQGDALNLEIACTDSTTDGEGYAAIVEYRVLKHAGG